MLRSEGSRGWTAEQHEAAAAALGTLAAALTRMGNVEIEGWTNIDTFGRGMDVCRGQIAGWTAQDAASHANAAAREREQQAEYLLSGGRL